MTKQELEELLPLYVNGRLDDRMRKKVEDALAESPQAREALRYWKEIAHISILDDTHKMTSHPTAEEIVDYATGALRDPHARVMLERHIQACATCLKEVEVIREMKPDGTPSPGPGRRRTVLKDYRLAFLLPLAAAVFLVVMFLTREDPSREAEQLPDRSNPPVAEETQRTPVVITYSLPLRMVVMRGRQSSENGRPEFVLEEADSIVLKVPVLYSKAAAAYWVQLHTLDEKRIVADTLQAISVKDGIAHLRLASPAERITAGRYSVAVHEILRPDFRELDPEKYFYEFELKAR